MKKTLIAIAALAATGAFAQSTVTISGQMDAGFASTTTRGSPALASPVFPSTVPATIYNGVPTVNAAANYVTAANGMTTRGMNTGIHGASRLRFVGVEDMGAGNKATFWLEMQPSFVDGSTNASLFNRGAWLGLQGSSWGEVRLGRQGTNTIGLICAVDQLGCYSGFSGAGILFNGNTAPGTSGNAWIAANPTRGFAYGVAATTAQASSTSGDSTRYTRAIRYSLPTLVKGLSVNVTNAYGATNTANGAGGGNTLGFDATYSAGPLVAGLAVQRAGAETAANSAEGSLTTFGGTYNFGVARIGAIYQTENATAKGTTTLGFDKSKGYALTATVPMGQLTPYFKMGNRTNTLGSGASVTTAKMLNIGTRYALSKTTNLYADYVRNSADSVPLVGANTATITTQTPAQMSAGIQINF